jgi:hypothetical protein
MGKVEFGHYLNVTRIMTQSRIAAIYGVEITLNNRENSYIMDFQAKE